MTTSHKRLPDYKENEQIIWERKCIAATYCVLIGFVIAVALVTSFIILFVPAPGDKF
jgi:hypothetical protein